MIKISDKAFVSKFADLEDSIRGTHIIIHDGATIDSFVKVKPAGGVGDVVIGRNSIINSGCVIYTGNGVSIGESVLIAANCTLAPVNHGYIHKHEIIRNQGFLPSKGGIIIEDDVWIGANTVILDGAIIRQGTVVAAGSLVRGELEAYSIYAGNPLQKKGYRI